MKSSSDGEVSGVQEAAGTPKAVWWGTKEDEHHGAVGPRCLPRGWAVHLCSPVTSACGRAESRPPSLANGELCWN